MGDSVVGWIVTPTKFQFVFQSEEALNLILRRGLWSFSEWMLVTQRWFPNMCEDAMKSIPLSVQIRGIPSQFLNREMIDFIGDTLGPVVCSDFNETTSMVDFVRVKINWNIDNPIRFQRNFQFSSGENTIFSFRYECMRNFCVKCGTLTHEGKDCPLYFDDGDDGSNDDGDDNQKDSNSPNTETNETESVVQAVTVAGPSSVPTSGEKTPSVMIDEDMTTEKGRFVQTRMQQDIHSGFGKRKRQEIEEMLREYEKEASVNTDDLYADVGHVMIPGINQVAIVGLNEMKFSEMSAGMENFRDQLEDQDYQRKRLAKGKFCEDEFLDVFGIVRAWNLL